MVLQGWDLNSSSTTSTTPLPFSHGGGDFGTAVPYVSHQDGVCLDWFKNFTASEPFQCLFISIMNGWRRLRLVYVLYDGHHTTCFPVRGWVKVVLPVFHFSHQDWVSLDWFGQFTASQPFHSLSICIMNGFARLRFEFIIHNQHHTPTF